MKFTYNSLQIYQNPKSNEIKHLKLFIQGANHCWSPGLTN